MNRNRLAKLPNVAGMEPLRLLASRTRNWSDARLPSVAGTVPNSRLPDRSLRPAGFVQGFRLSGGAQACVGWERAGGAQRVQRGQVAQRGSDGARQVLLLQLPAGLFHAELTGRQGLRCPLLAATPTGRLDGGSRGASGLDAG